MSRDFFPTYDVATAWLHARINYERPQTKVWQKADFKLERMRQLLAQLGKPQHGLPVIHIAGTKGKGSTAAFASAILQASRYRVGLFTSPHVHSFEERMTVDGRPPNKSAATALLSQVAAAATALEDRDPSLAPTWFECITAMAWLHFRDEQVDLAVMEVGLGGRLDSTNICEPAVCAITNISRDHTPLLGETLAEIAREKAGIIKQGIPVVIGNLESSARTEIIQIAGQKQAPVIGYQDDLPLPNSLGLPGLHQQHNARLAMQIVRTLAQYASCEIDNRAMLIGLQNARLFLRCELIALERRYLLDGAHNWASAKALKNVIANDRAARKTLVFSASHDKDAVGMLRLLLPEFTATLFPSAENRSRAIPAHELLRQGHRLGFDRTAATPSLDSAISIAKQLTTPDDLICFTGSFFLASAARALLVPEGHAVTQLS